MQKEYSETSVYSTGINICLLICCGSRDDAMHLRILYCRIASLDSTHYILSVVSVHVWLVNDCDVCMKFLLLQPVTMTADW
jgi:hypothetical protein